MLRIRIRSYGHHFGGSGYAGPADPDPGLYPFNQLDLNYTFSQKISKSNIGICDTCECDAEKKDKTMSTGTTVKKSKQNSWFSNIRSSRKFCRAFCYRVRPKFVLLIVVEDAEHHPRGILRRGPGDKYLIFSLWDKFWTFQWNCESIPWFVDLWKGHRGNTFGRGYPISLPRICLWPPWAHSPTNLSRQPSYLPLNREKKD